MNCELLNKNYALLPESYLFSEIARKIAAFQEKHPEREIIRLGIGDVTRPLVPAVIEAMHRAVGEMADPATFRGYGPEPGYPFLREAVAAAEYGSRNIDIGPDEIFVSDGSKCDVANIQELFSADCSVAIPDPVYPVYLDSNVMAGRGGRLMPDGRYGKIHYMACGENNGFQPNLPPRGTALIYLCSPNNPTGTVLSRATLEKLVAFALDTGAVILFDAAYADYIRDDRLVHTIYEIPGAKKCAVEFHSFSKSAGFTGVRCAFTVIPREMETLRRMWLRRQSTKFNGVNYIVQRAAEAVYTPAGREQTRDVISGYMRNAGVIREGLRKAGYTVFGGEHAPYIWWRLPDGVKSQAFFDFLLEKCAVVGTPGSGFGPEGEGFFRLTAFGDPAKTREAVSRIAEMPAFPA
ncbi:MAG: LL-diaminopimelate aminotransferase [Lentisphaeria bacterium]|nr:LL-diaminopimelate aminotransferase [Lentisphaeria bacterium]